MDWKDKLSGLKSLLPEGEQEHELAKVEPQKQLQKEPLRVELDKRKGKPATLITDFMGSEEELK